MSLWPSQRVWKLLLPAFSDRPKSIGAMRLETALAYDAFLFSAVAGARSAVEDSHFLPSRDKNGIRITRVTTFSTTQTTLRKPLPDLKPEIKLGGDVAATSGITLKNSLKKWMVFSSCLFPPRSWRAIQSQGKFPKQGTDSQDHRPGKKLVTKIEGSCV